MLFGPGAVHGLDGTKHHRRKAMFLDVLRPDAVAGLADRAQQEWASAIAAWQPGSRVVLFDAAGEVLAASELPWAGITLQRVTPGPAWEPSCRSVLIALDYCLKHFHLISPSGREG